MKTFEQLTAEQQTKVLKKIKNQILDNLIEGVFCVEDVELQKSIDSAIEGSRSVEGARLHVSVLLDNTLITWVLNTVIDLNYTQDGDIVMEELKEEDFLFL